MRFCHNKIEQLVQIKRISSEDAAKILIDEFEASSLSSTFVFNLVYDGIIDVSQALKLKKTDYENSALSVPVIYMMVDARKMTLEQALTLHKEEVINPVEYLSSLDRLSPKQKRRLELYEVFDGISPQYVERIIVLESLSRRAPSQEEERTLLLNPSMRQYAEKIVWFKYYAEGSEKDQRHLSLLYDIYAREYAKEVVELEYKNNISQDDQERLANLYLRICCKISKPNPLISQLAKRASIEEGALPVPCSQAVRGPNHTLFDAMNGMNHAGLRQQMANMKSVFQSTAERIVYFSLDDRKVPNRLWQEVSIQNYVEKKKQLVYVTLLKYFVGGEYNTSGYSLNQLQLLEERICDALQEKALSLDENSSVMTLPVFINTLHQSLEAPQLMGSA